MSAYTRISIYAIKFLRDPLFRLFVHFDDDFKKTKNIHCTLYSMYVHYVISSYRYLQTWYLAEDLFKIYLMKKEKKKKNGLKSIFL